MPLEFRIQNGPSRADSVQPWLVVCLLVSQGTSLAVISATSKGVGEEQTAGPTYFAFWRSNSVIGRAEGAE